MYITRCYVKVIFLKRGNQTTYKSYKYMKTNKLILTFIFILANLLTFSQLKVLSTGKIVAGGGTSANAATINISDTNTNTIFSSATFTLPWCDAIKSKVNRTDAIAFSAYLDDSRNFMVFGNGDIWGNGTHITGSDSILKYDIKNVESATDMLKQLHGVTYKKKDDKKDSPVKHIGLIAQEVEKILPNIVYTDDHGVKGIAYEEIIPLLIEAIKDQQVQIEEAKSTLASIEANCCNAKLKSASLTPGEANSIDPNFAKLDQNIPNPFSKETKIGCLIPESATTSFLYIYNMNGTQLQQYGINGKGKQTVTIYGNSFEPGMYLYALVIDGREVDTKRMILTK